MFQKANNSQLYEEVIRQIKNLLENGQLKKGDLLPSEDKLSEGIGVSRATVREALKVLGQMGIVETKRGVGTFIKLNDNGEGIKEKFTIVLEEYKNNFEYIMQIDRITEPTVARLAAENATEEDIAYIEKTIVDMENGIKRGEDIQNMTIDFHIAIIAAIHNPILLTIKQSLKKLEESSKKIYAKSPYNAKCIAKEHRGILDAIKKKDGQLAYNRMEEHLSNIASRYKDYFNCLFDEDSK